MRTIEYAARTIQARLVNKDQNKYDYDGCVNYDSNGVSVNVPEHLNYTETVSRLIRSLQLIVYMDRLATDSFTIYLIYDSKLTHYIIINPIFEKRNNGLIKKHDQRAATRKRAANRLIE